jgi:hypothetical protein
LASAASVSVFWTKAIQSSPNQVVDVKNIRSPIGKNGAGAYREPLAGALGSHLYLRKLTFCSLKPVL